MSALIVPSYAKLNLFLRVVGARADGYHEIETVFERISLCDTVVLSSSRDHSIRVRCKTPGIPVGAQNLCYRAAAALKERFAVPSGCEIRLVKRVPAGSGMGGGSSNAAAVLRGLCRLWRLRPTASLLMEIGAGIGSDVPFFLLDRRFAAGTGRGEHLRPFPGRGPTLYHVILVPPVHASTADIYAAWDRLQRRRSLRELTTSAGGATMIFSALKRRDLGALNRGLDNDLEKAAGKVFPAIHDAKKQLSQEPGAAGALMTGSGSAVFGIFTSRHAAVSCARSLSRRGSRAFFAETR